jgi:glycosyltransferase involved in cell wall biosynthesis
MRILQVTPYYAPAWAYGGPPRVMSDFASGLAARGHDVDVLTTDVLDNERRATPREEVLDGVLVRRLPNLSNSLAWRTKKYLPRGLMRRLAREAPRYDVVHVTDIRTYLTAAAYLATRARRTPLAVSAHGSLPGSTGLRGKVKDVYDMALVRPMLRRAALLFAQTAHEARLYEQFGGLPGAIVQLPLPLPPLDLEHTPAIGSFRRSIGVPKGMPLLLFLGRVNRLKGLDVLIESVEPLLDQGTVLAVVGRDDGQLGELHNRFADRFADGSLRFAGPRYGADRFAAYGDADVFCLTPRHWEETSVAALEAAACGTPVVVTEQSELPGLGASGGGFVVPLRQEDILAAVSQALGGGAEMGARARAHVLAQHGRDAVVSQLEGYLLSVAEREPAGASGR